MSSDRLIPNRKLNKYPKYNILQKKQINLKRKSNSNFQIQSPTIFKIKLSHLLARKQLKLKKKPNKIFNNFVNNDHDSSSNYIDVVAPHNTTQFLIDSHNFESEIMLEGKNEGQEIFGSMIGLMNFNSNETAKSNFVYEIEKSTLENAKKEKDPLRLYSIIKKLSGMIKEKEETIKELERKIYIKNTIK